MAFFRLFFCDLLLACGMKERVTFVCVFDQFPPLFQAKNNEVQNTKRQIELNKNKMKISKANIDNVQIDIL